MKPNTDSLQNQTKGRTLQEVTYAKAVGIVLMVMCHAGFSVWGLDRAVYMFHMPLFFFMAGFCMKTEYLEQPARFLRRRLKGIYWPYLKWSIAFLLLHNAFLGCHLLGELSAPGEAYVQPYGWLDLMKRACVIIFAMKGQDLLLGGYWFLRTLLTGSLIAFVVIWLLTRRWRKAGSLNYGLKVLIGGGILLTLACLFNAKPIELTFQNSVFFSARDLLAAVFFLIGHAFRVFRVGKLPWWGILLAAGAVAVGACYWHMGTDAFTYENRRMLPYVITAVLGTWAVYSLPWQRLHGRVARGLQFVGNNTLTVLTWHFLAFKVVTLLLILCYHLPTEMLEATPVLKDYAPQGWWAVYLLVAMLQTCAIAYCNRWIKSAWLKL